MIHRRVVLAAVALFSLVVLNTAALGADKKPVKLNKQFNGSVQNAELMKSVPEVITDVQELNKLWKRWNIRQKQPQIDFKEEIVVLATSRGSVLKLTARLDDEGNLEVLGMGTRDLRPGFRYVIATVSRKGIKKVNGKDLPEE